jgi:hypothetical protein
MKRTVNAQFPMTAVRVLKTTESHISKAISAERTASLLTIRASSLKQIEAVTSLASRFQPSHAHIQKTGSSGRPRRIGRRLLNARERGHPIVASLFFCLTISPGTINIGVFDAVPPEVRDRMKSHVVNTDELDLQTRAKSPRRCYSSPSRIRPSSPASSCS